MFPGKDLFNSCGMIFQIPVTNEQLKKCTRCFVAFNLFAFSGNSCDLFWFAPITL
uniref:Uncharacterized protein n=1 Tax=Arundo donax TaxID=35708 RepID=A0A0A8Z8W5_ARUDO